MHQPIKADWSEPVVRPEHVAEAIDLMTIMIDGRPIHFQLHGAQNKTRRADHVTIVLKLRYIVKYTRADSFLQLRKFNTHKVKHAYRDLRRFQIISEGSDGTNQDVCGKKAKQAFPSRTHHLLKTRDHQKFDGASNGKGCDKLSAISRNHGLIHRIQAFAQDSRVGFVFVVQRLQFT
ncbi:hypothetical protein CLF_102496 [Clonorchis sinensis]|uniref:Uncharacterized protein n=1 Tax=Clonorchis sinensis TaxID=79923 RepID=G7YN24_CLOSI|nr:hypothetical protein CLF_102496 [Clonorchis sinensis]